MAIKYKYTPALSSTKPKPYEHFQLIRQNVVRTPVTLSPGTGAEFVNAGQEIRGRERELYIKQKNNDH